MSSSSLVARRSLYQLPVSMRVSVCSGAAGTGVFHEASYCFLHDTRTPHRGQRRPLDNSHDLCTGHPRRYRLHGERSGKLTRSIGRLWRMKSLLVLGRVHKSLCRSEDSAVARQARYPRQGKPDPVTLFPTRRGHSRRHRPADTPPWGAGSMLEDHKAARRLLRRGRELGRNHLADARDLLLAAKRRHSVRRSPCLASLALTTTPTRTIQTKEKPCRWYSSASAELHTLPSSWSTPLPSSTRSGSSSRSA